MKTFKEILESESDDKWFRRKFDNMYEKPSDVPDDKKTYSKTLEREFLKLLKPLAEQLEMKILAIEPGWRYSNYVSQKRDDMRIYGSLTLTVEAWKINGKDNQIFMEFISKKDLRKATELIRELQGLGISKFYLQEMGGGREMIVHLTDHILSQSVKNNNVDFDLKWLADFSEQCFYQQGPDWEKFKEKHKGSLANEKFIRK